MASFDIPTIDVSPFFRSEKNEEGRKKAIEQIREACVNYGFFQIVNHGIHLELLRRTLDTFKTFFACPDEEKLSVPSDNFSKSNHRSAGTYEQLLLHLSSSSLNVWPKNPPHFKQVMEEIISHFNKLGVELGRIVSECLGLPPNFLENYRNNQSWDAMIGVLYRPTTDVENIGKSAHNDPGGITILYQDEVGGLQVHKDEQWIPIVPSEDKLVVNIGDVIQVISNNKFKSGTHRVIRPREINRYSCAYFYSVPADKWVEPLPEFTKEIGESPKYRGFFFKEYMQLKLGDASHPPPRHEDLFKITHYSISN